MEDDAARANWGGEWRMPTSAEFKELINNTTVEVVTQNGVKGRKFTSNINGNSIFFPSTGHYVGGGVTDPVTTAYYWTSTLFTLLSPTSANCLVLRDASSSISVVVESRSCGLSVRPVRPK